MSCRDNCITNNKWGILRFNEEEKKEESCMKHIERKKQSFWDNCIKNNKVYILGFKHLSLWV